MDHEKTFLKNNKYDKKKIENVKSQKKVDFYEKKMFF